MDSSRLAVVIRADGGRGPEVASGLRVLYGPTVGTAIEVAIRRQAPLFVVVDFSPSASARITARVRRLSSAVAIVVLLRPPSTPTQESLVIDAGADAVAHYPMPGRSWLKLWRIVLDLRQSERAARQRS